MNYAFIGGGNMGSAMAAAVVEQGICAHREILIVEPDALARDRNGKLGFDTQPALTGRIGQAPVIVLAVKPQSAPEVYPALKPLLSARQVVVSIMAGIPMAALAGGLGHSALVRVMPNTPAQVGMGMNVFYPHPSLAANQLDPVEAMLGACGEALRVDSEDAIDAATAVSGSGPAYVYYLAEHWLEAARQLGFSERGAEILVQQTLAGATALWKAQGIAVSTLRENVTSKGGTTAAALERFQDGGMAETVVAGVRRAYERAKELGQ